MAGHGRRRVCYRCRRVVASASSPSSSWVVVHGHIVPLRHDGVDDDAAVVASLRRCRRAGRQAGQRRGHVLPLRRDGGVADVAHRGRGMLEEGGMDSGQAGLACCAPMLLSSLS